MMFAVYFMRCRLSDNYEMIFAYFFIKTYVVGVH